MGDPHTTLNGTSSREAALREILAAISRSRHDEGPVFETILRKACDLCETPFAGLYLVDPSESHAELVTSRGARSDYLKVALTRWPLESEASVPRSIATKSPVHIGDLTDTESYRARTDPRRVEAVEIEGIRTFLSVPLLDGDVAIGAIGLYRREVRPFAPDQIALLEAFAEQAVIAIENVRQFRELQTRLEREAATREILEVISRSRDNEQPVFDVILENASRLCNAPLAFVTVASLDGAYATIPAHRGARPAFAETLDRFREPIEGSVLVALRPIAERRVIRQADISDDDLYRNRQPHRVAMVEEEGIRSILAVPLLRNGEGIGSILLYRREVRPFSDEDVALIEAFAAQAVIAIENVRQFRELQTRLEREAATREILSVISRSRDNEQPVFDAVLENACKLCHAPLAYLSMVTEDRTEIISPARRGAFAKFGETLDKLRVPYGGSPLALARAISECRVILNDDISDDELYRARDPNRVSLVEDEGARSLMVVPLIQNGIGIGSITLYRREVAPFSDDDVAVVEGFAAQAVIAIENVRQFRELQTRLEREAATRGVLEVISRSRDDEQPVFDAILDNALKLCRSRDAVLGVLSDDGMQLVIVAGRGETVEYLDWMRANPVSLTDPESSFATVQRTLAPVHIPDVKDTDRYRAGASYRRKAVDEMGLRTMLQVPLISGGKVIGLLSIARGEVAPYTPDEIALFGTFAAQAVIAIENVRQFRELQTRLEREAATRGVLEVISRSRDDEQPVFDTILENAQRLCGAPFGNLNMLTEDGERLEIVADGLEPFEPFRPGWSWPIDSGLLVARSVRERKVLQWEDAVEDPLYAEGDRDRVTVVEAGVRTVVTVPLISNGVGIGSMGLYRREKRLFTPDEIALVEMFAAQAVIAIENVRQFREVQTRLAREKASAEILEVISQSRDDEGPVFEAILRRATELCDVPDARLDLADDARTSFRVVCAVGETPRATRIGEEYPLDLPHIVPTTIREGRGFHVPDLADTDLYRQGDRFRTQLVDGDGWRSYLTVPLIRDGLGIGCIVLSRHEVRPFTEDQIALLETFAAQAVIAIENVRQFRSIQSANAELTLQLEREAAVKEILTAISQSRDDEGPVFDAILDNAERLCDTPLTALYLVDPAGAELLPVAAKGFGDLEPLVERYRRPMDKDDSSLVRCVKTGKIVQIDDMSKTDLYQSGHTWRRAAVEDEGIRTSLAIPLMERGRGVGVLMAFRQEVRPFSTGQVQLLEAFAAQAVIAIENVRQFKALEALNSSLEARVEDQVGEIERMGRLKRFLSPAVAEAVVTEGEAMLSSHRALIATLFCDIRGFTAFCETAEPEETIEVLQTYHEEMGKLISAHGGGIDKRMGDGIMVILNDPLPCEDPAGDAVRLAIAMHARMKVLCKTWKRLGHRLGFGVGISLGYATVGMVGSEGRYDYTASGTSVNLAARLCDQAEDGEILLSPRARTAVEDDFQTEAVGEIDFKGLREPVDVFRLNAATAEQG